MVLLSRLVTSAELLQVIHFLLLHRVVRCDEDSFESNELQKDCQDVYEDCVEDQSGITPQVCGMDGQSYLSECHLLYRGCLSRSGLRVAYRGPCNYGAVISTEREANEKDESSSSSSSAKTPAPSGESTENGEDEESDKEEEGEGKDDEEDDGDSKDDDSEEIQPTTGGLTPATDAPPPTPAGRSYCVRDPSENPLICKPCSPVGLPKLPELKVPCLAKHLGLNAKCFRGQEVRTTTQPPTLGGPAVEVSLSMGTTVLIALATLGLISALAGATFLVYKKLVAQQTFQVARDSGQQTSMTDRSVADEKLHTSPSSGSVYTASTTV